MNWYKKAKLNKVASLTLYISGYKRDDGFENIHSIAWALNSQLYNKWMDKGDLAYHKEFGIEVPSHSTITIDGTEVDDLTGTINFYTNGINPAKISTFANNILEFLHLNQIKTGQLKEEKSRMFNSEVIRIPILTNPKGEHKEIEDIPPEINMANNNAFFIFNKVLGYDRNLWEESTFDPIELKKRIEYYEGETKLREGDYAGQNGIQLSPEEAFDPDMLSGKKAISSYNEENVRRSLNRIKLICDWAIGHNYKELYVA